MEGRYRQMTDMERMRAWDLRLEPGRKTYEEIAAILGDEAEDGRRFDRATIHRAVKNMPQLALDEPFEWHRLNEYGLPWEASGFLLEMWAYVKELSADLKWALDYSAPLPPPTVRQAHWWWRVHQAAPDQDKVFIQLWAEALWQCELHKDVLGKTVDVSDIEAYLAYRPWVSKKHEVDYDQAVQDGRIPQSQTILENFGRLDELRDRPELSQHFPKPGPGTLIEASLQNDTFTEHVAEEDER